MKSENSKHLMDLAAHYIPGGVNSPVRAFNHINRQPKFIAKGEGPYIWDVDGNRYIDYVGSWGPLILGHQHPSVKQAIVAALNRGWSYGAPTEVEVELARLVGEAMPSIEMIRMVNSGTEATLSAIRLARGFTGKEGIIKFAGCYHGHSDGLLVKAGSGVLTHSLPDSAGVPKDIVKHTHVATFNDLESVERLFQQHPGNIAAIIVEPVAANMNLILPHSTFLSGLRTLCDQQGALLIFDEVITGFRVSWGGAQSFYRVTPDLTCLGKILGGGFPVGAFGGRRDVMSHLAPLGPVYQAGTLSGNPIAMTAGLATLRALQSPGVYEKLAAQTKTLATEMQRLATALEIPFRANCIGSLFGLHFTDDPEQTLFKQFFLKMLEQGVYLAPSAFEAGFVSTEHDTAIIRETLEKANTAFCSLKVECEVG